MNNVVKPFYRAIFFIFFAIFIIAFGCEPGIRVKNFFAANDSLNVIKRQYEPIEVIIPTYLGNWQRNYYGDSLPDNLEVIWTCKLGTGKTRVGSEIRTWSGAGWTGQPLLIRQEKELFLIQGAYDYNLRKINAETGEIVWEYKYDDVIKGTATIWYNKKETDPENQLVILQGSRMGFNNSLATKIIDSYRAVSYMTGKPLWFYNSERTDSYSRDVDGSAIVLNDTAYLGLETGMFITFNPDYRDATTKDGLLQPQIYSKDSLYTKKDKNLHGGNLVTESSASLLNNKIYIASGSGHIYGYNLKHKKIDWDFFIGSDIDGSPIVTSDECIIVSIEKQYIAGKGGILKLNPAKDPKDAVVWFFPTENKEFTSWHGGVIGSAGINDYYIENKTDICIAAFVGIDEYFYIVNHKEIDSTQKVLGFDNKTKYYMPKLLYKENNGPSISTPIIVKNRILCPTYNGLYLYEFDKDMNFKKIATKPCGSIEATPITHKGQIYVAARDGLLYCLGKKNN